MLQSNYQQGKYSFDAILQAKENIQNEYNNFITTLQ